MKKDYIVTILLVFNILMVSCTTMIKRQGATGWTKDIIRVEQYV